MLIKEEKNTCKLVKVKVLDFEFRILESLNLNEDLYLNLWFLWMKVWVIRSLEVGSLEVKKDQSLNESQKVNSKPYAICGFSL